VRFNRDESGSSTYDKALALQNAVYRNEAPIDVREARSRKVLVEIVIVVLGLVLIVWLSRGY